MNNGDGLRVVLWVAGCDHRCYGCFNPETWETQSGDVIGKEQENLINETLSKDWCSGITFTGGDPLHPDNRSYIAKQCEHIKKDFPSKTIWIYTGYTYEELKNLDDNDMKSIFRNSDVIVDGEYIQESKSPSAHWIGSANQRVIDIQKSLNAEKIIVHGE